MKIKQSFLPPISMMFLALLTLLPYWSFSQTDLDSVPAVTETKLKISYLCLSNDSVMLTGSLDVKREDLTRSLQNAVLHFFAGDGTTTVPVGQAITDQEGKAVITFPVAAIPFDKDGIISYAVRFEGNDTYPPSENDLLAKPAAIHLSFGSADSLKIVEVYASAKDIKGSEIPLAGETVILYVPRLFSMLKVGEVTLDESGMGTVEFPQDIIGDSVGNVKVIAMIEEHDIYNFVQASGTINWGVPKHLIQAERPTRELWTPVAPLWMIITLIIMLVGVWAHYVYAVYELFMIKRLSKKSESS